MFPVSTFISFNGHLMKTMIAVICHAISVETNSCLNFYRGNETILVNFELIDHLVVI